MRYFASCCQTLKCHENSCGLMNAYEARGTWWVRIFCNCWNLNLPLHVHTTFIWEIKFLKSGQMGGYFQGLPAESVTCNVSTKKLKLLSHTEIESLVIFFLIFFLDQEYPLNHYLERNQLLLENKDLDLFFYPWVGECWHMVGALIVKSCRKRTVSCKSCSVLARIAFGQGVLHVKFQGGEKGCWNTELKCVWSSSINYTVG